MAVRVRRNGFEHRRVVAVVDRADAAGMLGMAAATVNLMRRRWNDPKYRRANQLALVALARIAENLMMLNS